MATRNLVLTGVCEYAKIFSSNRDMKGFEGAYEDCDGAYTINVTLDPSSFKKLKDAGSMLKGKMTEDGNTSVKFIRKHTSPFEWAGGAPAVTDPLGGKWDPTVHGLIPNGSTVTVHVSVYDTSRPSIKGTRLDKVVIDKLHGFFGVASEEGVSTLGTPTPAYDDGVPF